jgi:hypothetical protein
MIAVPSGFTTANAALAKKPLHIIVIDTVDGSPIDDATKAILDDAIAALMGEIDSGS